MMFREMVRMAIRDSVRDGRVPTLSAAGVRKALAESKRRHKVAKARGIKPGSLRWNALNRIPLKGLAKR